jgi:translocator assembly and maintenance protein 41
MLTDQEAESLLGMFPDVDFAFAYGSGAVTQGGYTYSSPAVMPMLDIILVVNDSTSWHTENLVRNPGHYSSPIALSGSGIALVQDSIPAHLWFNAFIDIPVTVDFSDPATATLRLSGRKLKYGVISRKWLLRDLQSWGSLYVAGRLHKPVHILKRNTEIGKNCVNHV